MRQDIAERVVESLNNLAPGEPANLWPIVVIIASLMALLAAVIVAQATRRFIHTALSGSWAQARYREVKHDR